MNDVIWVIVDQLTKYSLFLLMKITVSVDKLENLYTNNGMTTWSTIINCFGSGSQIHIMIMDKYLHIFGATLNLVTVFYP